VEQSPLVGPKCGKAVDQTGEYIGTLLLAQRGHGLLGCYVMGRWAGGSVIWEQMSGGSWWEMLILVLVPHNPRKQQHAVTRAGWITKFNLYSDGKCVVGIKPTYGYISTGAQLLGKGGGRGKDITLAPHKGEFVTKVEAKVGSR